MFSHQWFFQGKVLKIINGQLVEVWLDLGFNTWKKMTMKLNRICVDETFNNEGNLESSPATAFLEKHVKGKQAIFNVFRRKDHNGFEKFFIEIYIKSGDIILGVKDVNNMISNKHRLEGLININDLMVGQGVAYYFNFHKEK